MKSSIGVFLLISILLSFSETVRGEGEVNVFVVHDDNYEKLFARHENMIVY